MNTTHIITNNFLTSGQLFLSKKLSTLLPKFKAIKNRDFFYREEKLKYRQELDDRTKWRSFMMK